MGTGEPGFGVQLDWKPEAPIALSPQRLLRVDWELSVWKEGER